MNYQEWGSFVNAAILIIAGTWVIAANSKEEEEESSDGPRDFAEIRKAQEKRKKFKVAGAMLIGLAVLQFLMDL